jgi:hypothetical protein
MFVGAMKSVFLAAGSSCLLFGATAWGGDFDVSVPMRHGSAATFYVDGHLQGAGDVEFMVDTGSGYMTINEVTLASLKRNDRARYSRDLRGILADGSELIVPVYVIQSLTIGNNCRLQDVEAAVFPGATRQILGLNALKKAGPFIFSFEPPRLSLSNCPATATVADARESIAAENPSAKTQ